MTVQIIDTISMILVRWSITFALLLEIIMVVCRWRMLHVDTICDRNKNAWTVNQLYSCSLHIMLI